MFTMGQPSDNTPPPTPIRWVTDASTADIYNVLMRLSHDFTRFEARFTERLDGLQRGLDEQKIDHKETKSAQEAKISLLEAKIGELSRMASWAMGAAAIAGAVAGYVVPLLINALR